MTLKKMSIALGTLLLGVGAGLTSKPIQGLKAIDVDYKEAENFVYKAHFEEGTNNGFVFGNTKDTSYSVVVKDNSIALYDKDENVLKTSVGELSDSSYSLALVINEDLVRVYVNNEKAASIVYSLDEYEGGKTYVVGNCSSKEFFETDTYEGDFFLGGYTLDKLINLSDDNHLLETGEYTLDKGVLTISDTYLKTLEGQKSYTFRAVTSLTDFMFVIDNDFTGVSASMALDKIYHGNEAVIELSEDVEVYKVTIDDEAVEYTKSNTRITISKEIINKISSGSHKVKLYTEKGRPEVTMNLTDAVITYPEVPVPQSHFFFFVDISIFGGLILAYVGFQTYKKFKEEGGK